MKKFYGFFLLFTALMAFRTNVQAQVYPCAGITVSAESDNSLYRVVVTLDRSYDQAITVSGVIRDETNLSTQTTYSVTVPASSTSAHTAYFFQMSSQGDLNVITNSISPLTATSGNVTYITQGFNGGCATLDSYWLAELDSIGIIHNAAMAFSLNKLQNENLTTLADSTILRIASTYIAEFYTNRYGGVLQFVESDVVSDITTNGITPLAHTSLDMSDSLKATVGAIYTILSELGENETAQDFADAVAVVVNNRLPQLAGNEQIILVAFKNIITQSLAYWDENLDSWDGVLNNSNLARNEQITNDLDVTPNGPSMNLHPLRNLYARHRCAGAVGGADAGGFLQGAIRGCITGALFGAGVGCGPAAIFWGAVSGAASSLGSAIGCAAIR